MAQRSKLPVLKLQPLEIIETSLDGTRKYLRWHGSSHSPKPSRRASVEGRRLLRKAMKGVEAPKEPMQIALMYFRRP